MYNAQKPDLDDLPTPAQLLRSTGIALVAAVAILVTIVLPAEYGIDPTGAGRVLGLTEMGEIKSELAEEAEEDRELHGGDDRSGALDRFLGLFVGTAHAQESWSDEETFTLAPGAATETKMTMAKGATATYRWVAKGGRINFDLHAHGGGESHTYEKGRGKTAGDGTFTAPFAGEHGWFWRNRDSVPVTVTLQTRGDYTGFARQK
ncbi:MAG: transmembrane anchor protein [Pseudomonadota bacterium]